MPSAKGRPQSEINSISHRHYHDHAEGDGVTTEFPLLRTVLREPDVAVYVSGLLKLIDLRGVVNDYAIRGLTPGYPGDSNMVKFTVPPAPNAPIIFISSAG